VRIVETSARGALAAVGASTIGMSYPEAPMPNIGPLEIIIVLLILLVIFGPRRIPELGRSVGQGMRNFKESVTGRDRGDEGREIEARRASTPQNEPAPARGAEPTGEPRP
jgi:sec-independent protein translocase protein TatA